MQQLFKSFTYCDEYLYNRLTTNKHQWFIPSILCRRRKEHRSKIPIIFPSFIYLAKSKLCQKDMKDMNFCYCKEVKEILLDIAHMFLLLVLCCLGDNLL